MREIYKSTRRLLLLVNMSFAMLDKSGRQKGLETEWERQRTEDKDKDKDKKNTDTGVI